jgi:hypothetical protein
VRLLGRSSRRRRRSASRRLRVRCVFSVSHLLFIMHASSIDVGSAHCTDTRNSYLSLADSLTHIPT